MTGINMLNSFFGDPLPATQSGRLHQIRIYEPYLLTIHVLGSHPNMNDYYIANLRKLGVTDEEGNLLEGEPVITPP